MIDKKYLPSKNFLTALYIALGIIAITLVFVYWKPDFSFLHKNNTLALKNYESSMLTVDSDNDGLPDWKENLYGTDPKKADTDGDGTSDLDEINQNRDPLKANTAGEGQEPNDKIDPAIIEANKKEVEEYEKLNSTEKIARILLSDFIAYQGSDGELSSSSVDAIVQNALQNLPEKKYSGITKESDLNFVSTNKDTFNADMLIYIKNYYAQTESFKNMWGQDLVLLNAYISSNKDIKKDLHNITSKYQTIINNLIKTPIPAIPGSSGAVYHLAIINSLEKLIQIDNDIANTNTQDITGAISDLAMYNSTISTLLNALDKIDTALSIKRQVK